jgi:hypothetical protein
MTRSASVCFLGPEFNEFLFAPIGEDRNGMLLTVLSALARRDIDPWQEAANLAQLPRETAAQRLVALIAALPDRPWAHPDSGAIAIRLIALLPRRGRSDTPSRKPFLGVGAVSDSRAVVAFLIFFALALGAQYLLANHQLSPQADSTSASVSSTVPPPTSAK